MEISIQKICQFATERVRAAKSEELRAKYGDNTIILHELSYYYQAFDDDAKKLEELTNCKAYQFAGLTIAEFTKKNADIIFPRLVRNGYKLAIIED